MPRYNLKQIRDYWSKQAIKHKQSYKASWSDKTAIDLEIKEILKYLENGDFVLDAGCANGYSTIQFVLHKKIRIIGVDYSPEMIEQSIELLNKKNDKIKESVIFEVGDVMNLKQADNMFDKLLLKRVIASLGDYDQQLKGIIECIRVLKPGGLLIISDATLQGWRNLNKFRLEWHLEEIPMPSFNNYLDREKVIKDLEVYLELVETSNFSSTYFVGTRVFKPLLVKAMNLDINISDPNMEWNRWFAQLPAWGDYGTQELFVFKKK